LIIVIDSGFGFVVITGSNVVLKDDRSGAFGGANIGVTPAAIAREIARSRVAGSQLRATA
jgi:hypothetical protein